jgi:hypothetical protein
MNILQKRQISLLILLLALFSILPVKGINNDVPDENTLAPETEIYSAFDPLKEAEEMIKQSDTISQEQLIKTFPDVKIDSKKEPLLWLKLNSGNQVGILPSFYWGCFFGLVGVIVTGIISKWEGDSTTDSVAGMLVNGYVVTNAVIVGLIYILYSIEANLPDLSGCTVW